MSTRLARCHPEHGVQQRLGSHGFAGLIGRVEDLPPQNEIRRENLQRLIVVTADLEGTDLGTAVEKVKQTVAGLNLPSSVRVEYGGQYEEQQKSFHDLLQVLLLALALVFGVLLAEFRNFEAPIAILTSSVLSICGRDPRTAHHENNIQRGFIHGAHHGDRHRSEERHSAARCR